LAALLRRAEEGPGSGRALARTRTAQAMDNHLPPELTATALSGPPLPEPTPPAEPAAEPGPTPPLEPVEQTQVLVGEVVPFALFDPFADDLEAGR
jgi:hypothetical protein